ncbi:MAG: ATP-dependent RecD-like DNA helicase [Lachnospiraceae bacterium]|jgi:exodeoxyribonuclease V alpha subunit|nr:ATP-dependent RecD-like DNA helicase [Lachnospiraceae bacterium]
MEVVSGYIDHIVYQNSETGYAVVEMVSDGEEITLVGTLPHVNEGEFIRAEGARITHAVYGEQFSVSSFEIQAPEDVAAIEHYLGSGAIKGIGTALASRIVRKFGEDTFRIIEDEPERLAQVKGISENMARKIGSQVAEKRDMREAMIYLQRFGITLNLASRIFGRYGNDLYRIIENNPYRLAEDITGVGFRIADEIAMKAGIRVDSDFRIRSGILYVLQQALTGGHVYLPESEVWERTKELLGVEPGALDRHIADMMMERKIVVKETAEGRIIYAARFYYMEMNTAKMLHDLNMVSSLAEEEIAGKIGRIEQEEQIVLDDAQRLAVTEAVRNGLLIVTGGPGTGKTTTITTMLRYFESEEMEILLAAPTGRAARRMKEATGREAKTIHRLLEVNGTSEDSDKAGGFERNEMNPLEADVIIIDEMSMVDIQLMHALLKAISVGTRLILVGDVDQLPSVGPGNVLRDVIRSECFHVVKLSRIFRQAEHSDIIVNAHKINRGEHVEKKSGSRDFLFVRREDANAIINASITLVSRKLPDYVQAPMYDIQVMTPMRKGALGVERLNTILQQYLNPPTEKKAEKEFPQGIFREGDKVMQIKNNYQIEWEIRSRYGIAVEKGTGVFNGDTGIIRQVNLFSEQIEVEFDEGRRVVYGFGQAEELELAYAITIHKSQGSEYPAVVIPLLSGPRMLMNRNLLYTAVTRAKKCVCIVGLSETFDAMVDNQVEQRRYSSLNLRIQELAAFAES